MHDPTILDRLADFETPEEAVGAFAYHGTCETFGGPLRPNQYDGCLWLAYAPTVAQTYIPASGSRTLIGVSRWQMDEPVRPSGNGPSRRPEGLYAVALHLGFPAAVDVEFDACDRPVAYGTPPGYPTNREVVQRLAAMGYAWQEGTDFQAWVRTAVGKDKDIFLPKDHRMEGRLFIVDGVSDLKLYDYASGRDGDLTDVDYRKIDLFRDVEAQGYDGIIIHDFCQTETHGNVGHRAIGVFPGGIAKIRYATVPAVHWEWPARQGCGEEVSPEFAQAHEQARTMSPKP